MHLTDAERKVMEIAWEYGSPTAKELADALIERVGWSRTTGYTMISRCIKKQYLRRDAPSFTCTPLLSREDVSDAETAELLEHNFGGSADLLVASLIDGKRLSKAALEKLIRMLDTFEEKK